MDKYLAKNNITDYHDSDWYKAIMDNFGTTNSFTFTHVFDNRDNYFNASKGRRISFAAQWGGHGLGGDYDFYKFTVLSETNLPYLKRRTGIFEILNSFF